jgi:CDP-4-dehydro-6-deoxyglucose reductase, E3
VAIIRYAGREVEANGESVLEALLRDGVAVPNACRAGACQSCLLRGDPAAVPPEAQRGVPETLALQGYFLSCQWRPEHDVSISSADDLELPARIVETERLSDSVLRVRLDVAGEFAFRAGQYLTLLRPDGLARPYSIASLPEERHADLHVRRVPGGQMSGWLFERPRDGETVRVRGPAGACFYAPGREDQPLLLAGTGTGLAPLIGIARDALRQGHRERIVLYHGAVASDGLYLRETLTQMAASHAAFRYEPVVLNGDGVRNGRLDEAIRSDWPALKGWRAFLCGDPEIVAQLRRGVFLAGVASKDILADAFLPAPCN